VHTRRSSGEKFFNNGSIANEKEVLRFNDSGKTYTLGFQGCGDGARWAMRIKQWHHFQNPNF